MSQYREKMDNYNLLYDEEKQQSPILIVGMHNSGTSILAEILHKNGVFIGNNMDHSESHFFSIFLNDRIIMGGGNNWAKLPILSIEKVLSFKNTVGPFIKKHWEADYVQWGYDGSSKWGIKDPRLCVLLPLYLEIFPGAKIVHIRRNQNDVAASLSRRTKSGVGKLDDFEHWKQLTQMYTERVLEYAKNNSAYYELEYEELCTNGEGVIRQLFEFIEIPFTKVTTESLQKLSPSKIGSYQRYRKRKKIWRLHL